MVNKLKQTLDNADLYQITCAQTLKSVFVEYPNIVFKSFQLLFSISTKRYANIIYELFERLPSSSYSIKDLGVDICINEETTFSNNLKTIVDLFYITRKWQSFKMYFNGHSIDGDTFYYLCKFLGYEEELFVDRTQNYKKRKTTQVQKSPAKVTKMPETKMDLSTMNHNEILDSVVKVFITSYLVNFAYDVILGKNSDRIIIIENQVIIYFVCDMKRLRSQLSKVPCLTIQELTFNEMFKFNFSAFRSNFDFSNLYIDYLRFNALGGKSFSPDDYEYFNFANTEYPELELVQRYKQYPGILYHFLVISIVDENKIEHYGVGYTINSASKLFLKVCNELLNKNYNTIRCNGVNGLLYYESQDFIKTFLSLKGTPKIKRLEEMISYFVIDKHIKSQEELRNSYNSLLDEFKFLGSSSKCERGYYRRPRNRWKTEEMVYNIVHSLYGNYQVIYRYRPYYLKTERGQLSYDIYICGLKIAIEYQGQQHFYPIDYFGGIDHFESQQKRDELKLRLSAENDVSLVYINYCDDITPEVIKQKIDMAIST